MDDIFLLHQVLEDGDRLASAHAPARPAASAGAVSQEGRTIRRSHVSLPIHMYVREMLTF